MPRHCSVASGFLGSVGIAMIALGLMLVPASIANSQTLQPCDSGV